MFKFLRKNNTIDGNWLKVSDLKVGMQIAVPNDWILGMHQMGQIGNGDIGSTQRQVRDGDDVLWDEIESIEYVGTEQVWDIEVEGTHNFVGNNIFAHNTYGLPAVSGTTQTNAEFSLSATSTSKILDMGVAGGTTGAWIQSTDSTDLSSNSPLLLNPNGGNVGIGTTDPKAKLEIQTADTTGFTRAVKIGPSGFSSTPGTGSYIEFATSTTDNYGAQIGGVRENAGGTNGSAMIFRTTGTTTTPTEAMRITSGGLVGIGTPTPGGKLDVQGGDTAGGLVKLQVTEAANNPVLRIQQLNAGGNYADNQGILLDVRGAGRALTVQNGATAILTVLTSGNVGIGTTDPVAPLNVVYPYTKTDTALRTLANFSSNETPAVSANPFTLGMYSIGAATDAARTMILQTGQYNQSWGGSLVLNPYGGSVGIGTTTPDSRVKLHVSGGNIGVDPGYSLASTAAPNGVTGITMDGSDSSEYVALYTQDQDRLHVDLSGNVGIGTTAPLSKLSVGGVGDSDFAIYGNGIYGVYGEGSTVGLFGYSSGTAGVYGNGEVGVYGDGATMDFYGAHGEHTDGSAWTNGSDVNLKENFIALDNQTVLDKILSLPVTEWNYKSVKTSQHIGPMAQDFYSIFGLGADNISISTIDPSGIALVGIKALNEKIEAQNTSIEEMNLNLGTLTGEIVPTAGSKQESFMNSFFANVFVKVGDWLASADNGIKTIFARKITTKLLCIADEAGVKTCVEKIQLDNLLAKAGEVSASETNDVGGVITIDESTKTINPNAPVITLVGEATINLNIGDTYSELGATATDDKDTYVAVSITGVPDTSTNGIYDIHYDAVDLDGNYAFELIRKVIVGTGDYTLTDVSAGWSGAPATDTTPTPTTDTTTITDSSSTTTVPTGSDSGSISAPATTTTTPTTIPTIITETTIAPATTATDTTTTTTDTAPAETTTITDSSSTTTVPTGSGDGSVSAPATEGN